MSSNENNPMMKVTVYTAPWCRDCHVAKRWLNQNNIAYHEINIEETPGAAEEVIQQTGKRAIPQFVINGAWVQPYILEKGSSMPRWRSSSASLSLKLFQKKIIRARGRRSFSRVFCSPEVLTARPWHSPA